ncbi:MAG: hypothetical protein P8168_09000 [Deltaproteobacteria bacterium]|jgi:predicted RNase H-like nuclease (RuvC/YqgF family)
MSKRSTIGENPLDALIQENPLDTVVPDLSIAAKIGRGQPIAELLAEVQERLGTLEMDLKTLKNEGAGIKAAAEKASSLQGVVGGVQEELVRLRRDVEQCQAEVATGQALAAEVTRLQEELAQFRAAAGPGDLPWWMRKRKK